MPSVTRCRCCDLPVESCGKAIEDRQRAEAFLERQQRLARPGWLEAQYAGRCLRCGEWFEVSTPITRFAQGWACCG